MTRLSAWSDVLPGTLVTLRRGPLTGERVERTKAWTASGPYVSDTGVACIRVDVAGVVVSYPLDRVSLGWTEPAVSVGDVIDPPPVPVAPVDGFFTRLIVGVAWAYIVCFGLLAIIEAVRP